MLGEDEWAAARARSLTGELAITYVAGREPEAGLDPERGPEAEVGPRSRPEDLWGDLDLLGEPRWAGRDLRGLGLVGVLKTSGAWEDGTRLVEAESEPDVPGSDWRDNCLLLL